jgi:hypothetical protein
MALCFSGHAFFILDIINDNLERPLSSMVETSDLTTTATRGHSHSSSCFKEIL